MWDLHRRLDSERLPKTRTVVMFWFRDLAAKRSRYWLDIESQEVEVCLTNPGFEVHLTVETTLRTMVEVWMGRRRVQDAIESGGIELKGASRLAKGFPGWLRLSSFAEV